MTTTGSTAATEPQDLELSGQYLTEGYATDQLSYRHTAWGVAAAAIGGGLFTLLAWFLLSLTNLPAFSTSMVTKALSTAATVVVLAVVAVLVIYWLLDEHQADTRRRHAIAEQVAAGELAEGEHPEQPPLELHRPRWRVILSYLVCYLSPAALVVSTTAIPLSSTRLYLDGIQVDQGFRTQFLTRLTDTWALADMNYIDMPTYYPGAWFWFGGRLANLLGLEGWEVYQPWALISIAAAAAMLVPVWQRICGSLPVATGIALVSTCTVLVLTPDEPYAVIIALGVPAATVLARRAVCGSRASSIGLIIFLGGSAAMYTLFTGVVALSVILISVVFATINQRSWKPILRMIVIGLSSMAIALIFWAPFFWAVLRGEPMSGATATHFLPREGTEIPIPFLSFSVLGVLCLLGLIFLIVRAVDQDIRAMGIALAVFYVWTVASMVATLGGSTLLGFRLNTLIVLQLATAGVLALADIRMVGVDRLYPGRVSPRASRTITLVMVVLLVAGGLKYAQDIPYRNQDQIDQAYMDTDGYGERGDQRTPDPGRFYAEIDAHIQSFGYEPEETVVLTDEINFLAFNPYHGFQAFTSHYANPLGEFGHRNNTIEQWANASWSTLSDPDDFLAALDSARWQGPDVFLLRGSLEEEPEDGMTYHLAEDIYPNNPNVRYQAVDFNFEPFTAADSVWDTTQIGPFTVVTREQ